MSRSTHLGLIATALAVLGLTLHPVLVESASASPSVEPTATGEPWVEPTEIATEGPDFIWTPPSEPTSEPLCPEEDPESCEPPWDTDIDYVPEAEPSDEVSLIPPSLRPDEDISTLAPTTTVTPVEPTTVTAGPPVQRLAQTGAETTVAVFAALLITVGLLLVRATRTTAPARSRSQA